MTQSDDKIFCSSNAWNSYIHLFSFIFPRYITNQFIDQLPVHLHWDHRGQAQILESRKFFQAFFSQLTASVASATGLSLKARDWGFTPTAMSIRPSYSCRKQKENISKTLPSSLTPHQLISYFQQLEILVTALFQWSSLHFKIILKNTFCLISVSRLQQIFKHFLI